MSYRVEKRFIGYLEVLKEMIDSDLEDKRWSDFPRQETRLEAQSDLIRSILENLEEIA